MSIRYPDNFNDFNIYADDRTSSYYSSKAKLLSSKYSQTDDIFSKLFIKYLAAGSKILDIGCGSGRDMVNLKKSGFSVIGIDSSSEMIRAAINKYSELAGKIRLSGLPDMPGVDSTFNGVLCTAVLQHIPDRNLSESFRRIRELLENNGVFILSFPLDYPGIDPETNRDRDERLFYIRPEEKYRYLIERMGFSFIESKLQDDSLGREGIVWETGVWRRGDMDDRE